MTEIKNCPCCGRHCPMDDLHCGRGQEYARTGVIPPRDLNREHGHGEHGEHDHVEHGHSEHDHGEHGHEDCPCCGRHCPMDDLHCGRGQEYARTGVIPPRDPNREHGHGGHRHGEGWLQRYQAQDTQGRLIWNLRDVGHTIRAQSEGKASRGRVLTLLREEKRITQRELTERLGVQPSSVSEVLGKLEAAGWIERTASREDRRVVELALTAQGEREAEQAEVQRAQRHGEMFSCLTAEEQTQLLALLEKLNRDWRSRYRAEH
ncbi:MAG: MarR family winged helix-turn-helix transcriptional regulator [Candidatus Spyradocola sp.]